MQKSKQSRRLFGTAGIRGLTNIDITPLLALKIAQIYADYMCNRGTVAIGYDTRYGVSMLARATASGLMSGGINVIDCGCIPTGGLACWVTKHRLAGGIMITGSHTPYEMLGIIIMESDGAYLADKAARDLEQHYADYYQRRIKTKPAQIGKYKIALRPLEIYKNFLLKLVDQNLIRRRRYKVLVDPGNGTAGLVLPQLLTSLGCRVFMHNAEINPIPQRPPEPRAHNLGLTALKTRKNHCALGIATDIDADRVLFIDEAGKVLSEDLTGAIFAQSIFKSGPNNKVCVTPINSSGLIDKVCCGLNRRLIPCMIGAPRTMKVIKNLKACFGYEESGKYYFSRDIHWADGILAALKLLEIMARKNKSLSELAAEFPRFYQIKHTVRCPEHLKNKIMKRVGLLWKKELLSGRSKDITLDGLKKVYQDGAWLLIRRSGTEPLIRIYSDAPSIKRAEELVKRGEAMLRRVIKETT